MNSETEGAIRPIYVAPINVDKNENNIPWAKPIRIYQFVLIVLLLLLTWHNIDDESSCEGAFVLALYGTYFLITLVDLISQCGSDPIPDTPMFLFGVFGTTLFLTAAINMFTISRKDNVTGVLRLLICMVLSVTCAILFLVDVILIFLYGY